MERDTGKERGRYPRRYVLAKGARLAAVGGMAALLGGLGFPRGASAQDWRTHFNKGHDGGFGTVKLLQNTAFADGKPLKEGDRVTSGQLIRVGPYSRMILSLSDNTIMRINADTKLRLSIGAQRTGMFRLLVGSLLTVMPTGNRYLASLPNAVIGVKGTVFFQQIYHPNERFALDEKGRRVAIPEGVGEYFCLCNGEADYMDNQAGDPYYTDKSMYHNSWYIRAGSPKPMVRGPQLNHTDDQIVELVRNQDGEKHSLEFLRGYYEKKEDMW